MGMRELSPEAWRRLLAFGVCTLLALLAIAGQAALQHASRPRLRLLVEARVKGARGALKMLADDSPTPTRLLILLLVGTGGAASSLIAAALSGGPAPAVEAVLIAVLGGAA